MAETSFHFSILLIKAWVYVVDVFLVQAVLGEAQAFTEALEVHDLARTQEFDDITHVRIVGKAQNVVIRHARLLFRSQVLCEVRDGVARDLHGARRPRVTRGELRENARRVVDKVRLEPSLLDLLLGQIARKLVNDRADHLEMSQLLCADRGGPRTTSAKKPCATRVTGRKRDGKRECAKCRLAPFL